MNRVPAIHTMVNIGHSSQLKNLVSHNCNGQKCSCIPPIAARGNLVTDWCSDAAGSSTSHGGSAQRVAKNATVTKAGQSAAEPAAAFETEQGAVCFGCVGCVCVDGDCIYCVLCVYVGMRKFV